MKTSELTGAALDWSVAKCEGLNAFDGLGVAYIPDPRQPHFNMAFEPSTNWSQGGPIIEREGICVDLLLNGQWIAASRKVEGATMYCGPTPLIAAMRCYVASKLGDEVDVPEELRGEE
jgi:hypothetical protein